METINKIRSIIALFAESTDNLRVVPRIILVMYGMLAWKVVEWYMAIQPVIIDGVVLIEGPTTQHAALVTAVVGVAAAVIGLYQKSGKDWSNPFKSWTADKPLPKDESQAKTPE